MRSLVLILLTALALSAQQGAPTGGGSGPPAPPPPPATPTADLAALEGQVLNAIGGTPLRKATIDMNRVNVGPNSQGARNNYSTTTDASGHYSITGIEPGTYRLSASHTGFLNMDYNARRPQSGGTTLDIGRAEKKTGVDFRLTPHGVITGKITDEDGDPVQGVQVQIMRVMYNQGMPQMQINASDASNDLGEYRLSGITPGKYYLCATYLNRRFLMGIAPPGVVEDASSQEDYVPTFYPATTDVSAASPLELGPGDQVQGVNIRLAKMHTVRVSGRVLDTTQTQTIAPPAVPGESTSNAAPEAINRVVRPSIQLVLRPRTSYSQIGMLRTAQPAKPDGTFEFLSVPPGAYNLVASANTGGRGGAHAASLPLDVGNSNIEGVTLAIAPGVTVSGHVRYDGDPPSPLPSLTVRLTPREAVMVIPAPQPAKVDPQGNFHFDDVNLEAYNVNINTPSSLYLKSLRAGNTDIMLSGLDLSNGAGTLDILMGTNPPQVSGSVMNPATQQPAPAVTVVLMPREKERKGRSYFYSTTSTDQYGNFSFHSVIPGEYEVYAWEDVQFGQWFDPEWLKIYEGKGETLEAKEANPMTLNLTMIPVK
jgi:protocatechuate 3,4-dioxygenase beta subunit